MSIDDITVDSGLYLTLTSPLLTIVLIEYKHGTVNKRRQMFYTVILQLGFALYAPAMVYPLSIDLARKQRQTNTPQGILTQILLSDYILSSFLFLIQYSVQYNHAIIIEVTS